jgi:hypothetical protein
MQTSAAPMRLPLKPARAVVEQFLVVSGHVSNVTQRILEHFGPKADACVASLWAAVTRL